APVKPRRISLAIGAFAISTALAIVGALNGWLAHSASRRAGGRVEKDFSLNREIVPRPTDPVMTRTHGSEFSENTEDSGFPATVASTGLLAPHSEMPSSPNRTQISSRTARKRMPPSSSDPFGLLGDAVMPVLASSSSPGNRGPHRGLAEDVPF